MERRNTEMEMLMEHAMKTYTGTLQKCGAQTVTVSVVKRVVGSSAATVEKYELPLEPSLRVYSHSPRDGFHWGDQGLGCAQLALAILLDLTSNVVVSERLYWEFKRCLIGTSSNRLVITEPDIRAWIAMQGKQEA